MSFAMALKMFADCSLSLAFLGMVRTDYPIPLLIPAVFCAVSAGLATFFEEKNKPVLRRLCALLPWVYLLFGTNLLQSLLLAVPAAYCSLMILFGTLELEYYTYRQFLRRSLLLMGVGCFMVGAWSFVNQLVLEQAPMDIRALIRYGLVHLLCSILLLRQLRLGVGQHAEGGRQQITTILTVTLACTVLGEPVLVKGAKVIAGTVFAIVGIPFMLLVELVSGAIDGETPKGKLYIAEARKRTDEIRRGLQEVIHHAEKAPEAEPVDLTPLVTAAIIGVLVVAAVMLLVKSFQSRRPRAEHVEYVGSVPKQPKKKKQPLLSNRTRVRQAYRSFLRAEQDLGMRLHSSDTSEDVLGRIHRSTDRAGAAELRNVYLVARYDERQNISRKQVDQAKHALRATRKKQ